ncbi:flagellar basal body rod protein FlgC [Armatimonas sp.]|uniref:flagellar basal body rod protein FlgC n=1 Tax=Armatimonas sp. TaxID=1872638 RepID=UPI00286ACDD1|nr:flagellar basal body rod protein FlgC [Armatimonas sp.]
MSISSLRISGSGLSAERARLDTVSRNIANAETTQRSDGQAGPYLRQMVRFESITGEDGKPGGVKVTDTLELAEGVQSVHRPGHPDADANGNVAMPNVDMIEEMVDMIAATRAYEANVGAANATKTMISRAIELGRI